MPNITLLGTLSLVTLIIVVAFAFWQLRSVRRSQARRGEQPGDAAATTNTLERLAAKDNEPAPAQVTTGPIQPAHNQV